MSGQMPYTPAAIIQQRNYTARDFFVYNAAFATITAGASQTTSFTVQADSDFILSKLTAFATDNTGAVVPHTTPINCSLLITDTGSGRNLSDVAVPLDNLFGNAQLPFLLPRQRLFAARAVVTLVLTNNSAATYNAVKLSFIGEKAFY